VDEQILHGLDVFREQTHDKSPRQRSRWNATHGKRARAGEVPGPAGKAVTGSAIMRGIIRAFAKCPALRADRFRSMK
jgi:hypothetical protein